MRTASLVASSALILSACTAPMAPDGSGAGGRAVSVPDAVVAIAAPYQDLSTARLRPEDGCYWYIHAGPVETTSIPLRTSEGNPICSSASRAAAGGA